MLVLCAALNWVPCKLAGGEVGPTFPSCHLLLVIYHSTLAFFTCQHLPSHYSSFSLLTHTHGDSVICYKWREGLCPLGIIVKYGHRYYYNHNSSNSSCLSNLFLKFHMSRHGVILDLVLIYCICAFPVRFFSGGVANTSYLLPCNSRGEKVSITAALDIMVLLKFPERDRDVSRAEGSPTFDPHDGIAFLCRSGRPSHY